MENNPRRVSRREALKTFARVAAAPAVGIAAGEVTVRTLQQVIPVFEKKTHLKTGNAYTNDLEKEACGPTPSEKCIKKFYARPEEKNTLVVQTPLFEETMCRAMPSMIVSSLEQQDNPDIQPLKETLLGTEVTRVGLSRRELIGGAISSVVFGLLHNISSENNETVIHVKTVPFAQTVVGGVHWYLQRKLGIVAPIISHAWINNKN